TYFDRHVIQYFHDGYLTQPLFTNALDDGQFLAGEQSLDVHQYQHAFLQIAEPMDVVQRQADTELRRRFDLLRGQGHHVRHLIHHDTHHTGTDIDDDHHRLLGIVGTGQAEFQTQIDNRHDHATQVGHPLDEIRRIGDAGDVLVTPYLLDLENVDGVFLVTQGEHQEFTAADLGGFLDGIDGNQVAHDAETSLEERTVEFRATASLAFLLWLRRCRSGISRISATLPSPRMVAADTPGTLR